MIKKRSTYDIQRAAFAWLDGIEDAEGEVSESAESQLEVILGDVQDKATALFYARQRCRSMQAEAKELAEIAKVQKAKWYRHELRIMGYLRNLLEAKQATGLKAEVIAPWGKAVLRSTHAVEVEDLDAVGAEWKKEKTTWSIDTLAVKEALKAGETVTGCSLVVGVASSIRSKT
tara:strand:+ start:3327 stop:3848 length:522 start_codon:yes stop_codon:yes gene_type:complete